MNRTLARQEALMPAGEYWLGDPGYSFDDTHDAESWIKMGEKAGYFITDPVVEWDGRKILAFGTALGDGIYLSSTGRKYCVDSGLIGLVPVELGLPDYKIGYWCKRVKFDEPVACERTEDGELIFGDISIQTQDWAG